jgi:hypothetical protein
MNDENMLLNDVSINTSSISTGFIHYWIIGTIPYVAKPNP